MQSDYRPPSVLFSSRTSVQYSSQSNTSRPQNHRLAPSGVCYSATTVPSQVRGAILDRSHGLWATEVVIDLRTTVHRLARQATLLEYGYTMNLMVGASESACRTLPPGAQEFLTEAIEKAGE